MDWVGGMEKRRQDASVVLALATGKVTAPVMGMSETWFGSAERSIRDVEDTLKHGRGFSGRVGSNRCINRKVMPQMKPLCGHM